MDDLPDGAAACRSRGSQSCGQLFGAQEAHFAAAGLEDTGLDHAVYAGVLGLGERLGDAELAFELKPACSNQATAQRVSASKSPSLFGERLFERLVDERKRVAHRERSPADVEHARVAAEDGHAGADGGLGEVNGRDVAGLHRTQRRGQLRL